MRELAAAAAEARAAAAQAAGERAVSEGSVGSSPVACHAAAESNGRLGAGALKGVSRGPFSCASDGGATRANEWS